MMATVSMRRPEAPSSLPGGDYEAPKDVFAGFNEQACPLD
jgi:hypothetical protein